MCLSQHLDSLCAYFLLGPPEMLVSGHSIFRCSSSRGQLTLHKLVCVILHEVDRRTLCVDAAVDGLVIYFIHLNCHLEAGI